MTGKPQGITFDPGRGDRTNDTVIGTNFDDRLIGRGGNDYFDGGNGDDFLSGGFGNDTLIGGNQDDVIRAGRGNDKVWLGNGKDTFEFQEGRDLQARVQESSPIVIMFQATYQVAMDTGVSGYVNGATSDFVYYRLVDKQ